MKSNQLVVIDTLNEAFSFRTKFNSLPNFLIKRDHRIDYDFCLVYNQPIFSILRPFYRTSNTELW